VSDPSEILSPFFLSDDSDAVVAAAARALALSSGEVKNPEGLNPRTGKPERGGLQCARIFGPVQDHRCSCGKLASVERAGEICDTCGVLCGESRLRQERWGHIPSPVGLLHPTLMLDAARVLGCTPQELRKVLDEQANLNDDGTVVVARREQGAWTFPSEAEDQRMARGLEYIEQRLGPAAARIMPRTIPVTPSGWRGRQRDAQDVAYARIVNRGNRLTRLIELDAPPIILRNEAHMLQQAFEKLCRVVRQELNARQRSPAVVVPSALTERLLQAVWARPEEDGPRAVYGDHLAEREDPRGEFIALQLKNAHLSRMTRREADLLNRHLEQWLGPMAHLVDYVVFRRGFLARCRAMGPGASALVGRPEWATVERLETDQVALMTQPGMCQLRELRTNFRALHTLCRGSIALPRIQRLMLRMTAARPKGWEEVAATELLPGLEELVLLHQSRQGAMDFGWLPGTSLIRSLRRLTLAGAMERVLELAPMAWLDVLRDHAHLQELTLSYGKQALELVLRSDGRACQVRLLTRPRFLEWCMFQEERGIGRALGAVLTQLNPRRVSRFEVQSPPWFGEDLQGLARTLQAHFRGKAAQLPEVVV